jgi:deoxyribodipyrimidine photolyase-related protein
MPGTTAWILGDQLSLDNPALPGVDRALIVQSDAALRARVYHRQKLHLILVAMRHFADALRERGVETEYIRASTFAEGLAEHIERHDPQVVRLLAPSSAGGRRRLARLPRVQIVSGGLFLTDPEQFSAWAQGRRRVVMEDFYRSQRRRFGLLMDGEQPAGGRWNLDHDNRQGPPATLRPPRPYRPREDAHDAAVRAELDAAGIPTWGEDGPRRWPATQQQARRALRRFIEHGLAHFGPYQDAMLDGERTMWHSLLSSSLNLGLLDPLECAQAAERAYREGSAPLNSVEGFVRQIVGWREFIWGMYWHLGEGWSSFNALDAAGRLPALLEGAPTQMRCLDRAVSGLRETAYAHHIERLMLFGNLMLLAGTHPQIARDWYHRAFIDGYDWVMAPNVVGMATWADGGRMMTKPYAATGRYVNRMSDHCGRCAYRPGNRIGEAACPFTTLYWDFLARHRRRLASNRRMAMVLRNLDRIDADELDQIRRRAEALRAEFTA